MPRQKPSTCPDYSSWLYTLPEPWRVTTVNRDFKICDSYPEEVVVPRSVTDDMLKKIAVFRQSGRFPVLCYHHRKNEGALLRCGQPLRGSGQKYSADDIKLLNMCLTGKRRGQVLDVRSQSTAYHHTSKGGGTELPERYPQWKLVYGDMEAPTEIMTSLEKLMTVCSDHASSSNWCEKLDSTGWLGHVHKLMCAVQLVVRWIDGTDGTSVVVHGATGRDATLAVTSLAQLLLDPQNRTIEGFIRLIQREWLDAGYPFSSFHGSDRNTKERSPLFLLFLDAVWQITRQYPLSFEFNDMFLHKIFTHSHFSPYGTFLYDSPFERLINKLNERSYSLWSYLLEPKLKATLVNPYYSANNSVLSISADVFVMALWSWAYVRGSSSSEAPPPSPEHDVVSVLRETHQKLLDEQAQVRRELEKLQAKGREVLANIEAKCDQPTTEVKGDQPTTEVKGDQPTTEVKGDQPTTEVKGDQTTEVKGDQSTMEVKSDQPTMEVKGDQPTIEVKSDQPTIEVKGDQPTTEVKGDQPTTEVKSDQPPTEVKSGQPTTEVKGGQPTAEVKGGQPTTEVKGNQPAMEVKGDQPMV
eukprot:Em0005g1631a